MCDHEHYENELGPVYSVPLIDALPLNPDKPNGVRQQMPSHDDLEGIKNYRQGLRVCSAYEVLLHHWRVQQIEIERLQKMVSDCQSGLYVNCVYCGHRYGPNESTPVSMADVLKAHIAKCPKHPLKAALDALMLMFSQYHTSARRTEDGREMYDHLCMSAGEEAADVLIDHGLIADDQLVQP